MLDEQQIASICQSYFLGSPNAPLAKVTGGLTHSMFRLQTEKGCFAIKAIDRQIREYANIRDSLRFSEIVAAEAATIGVPAVCALSGQQGTVADIGSDTVLVYPWITGSTLPSSSAGPAAGRQIGAILGRLHRLRPGSSRFGAPHENATDADKWHSLAKDGDTSGAPWAAEIAAMVPSIIEWENSGSQASLDLSTRCVVSHNDLDQKNVLWVDADTPWVIDWECVGPVHPAVEVIAAALDWSGQSAGAPDRDTFVAVLAAYRSVADLSATDCRAALHIKLADGLGWLQANIDRSTDPHRSKEEQDFWMEEIPKTAANLRSISENMGALGTWCG